MASYSITFKGCKHLETVQIYGSPAKRERRVKQLQGGKCSVCRKSVRESRYQVLGGESRKWAESKGLPVLTGSDKQSAWAEQIRQAKLVFLSQILLGLAYQISQLHSQPCDPIFESLAEEPWVPLNWLAWADKLEELSQEKCPNLGAPLVWLREVPWLLGQTFAGFWIGIKDKEIPRVILDHLSKEAERQTESASTVVSDSQ